MTAATIFSSLTPAFSALVGKNTPQYTELIEQFKIPGQPDIYYAVTNEEKLADDTSSNSDILSGKEVWQIVKRGRFISFCYDNGIIYAKNVQKKLVRWTEKTDPLWSKQFKSMIYKHVQGHTIFGWNIKDSKK